MNLFEKIFNYQILSRLENSGTFMITTQERAWLKTMLQHPSATDAFAPHTLMKLRNLLDAEPSIEISDAFLQKARSLEKQVYHSLLRPLRKYISAQTGIQISYMQKNETTRNDEKGYPYKLEYSMVKREWYLLWFHSRYKTLISTKLHKIAAVSEWAISVDRAAQFTADIENRLEKQKQQAVIVVIRPYNRELTRILYAFSCFEKDVEYNNNEDKYTIRLTFLSNEREYVLSKIRFLGKRVMVLEDEYMRNRMLESAGKALGRYGE